MKVYIVEQPLYKEERIKLLPACEPTHFYTDMVEFCRKHELHKDHLKDSESESIVFLHGSNDESTIITPPTLLGEVASWTDGCEFVTFVASRVCQAGGRVVIYSGGTPKCDLQSFRDYLSRAGFHEGHHFSILKLDSIYKDHPDLASSLPITKEWRIDQLDRKILGTSPEIIALNVLLQGYLSVWSPEKVFKTSTRKNVGKIDRQQFHCFSSKNDPCLFAPEPKRESNGFWFDPLTYSFDTTFVTIKGKSMKWSAAPHNEKAWELVRNRGCIQGKRVSPEGVAHVFECAHLEFKAIESGLSGAIEIEKQRAVLNHDIVKNKFLLKLTCGCLDSDMSERTRFVTDVWKSLRGDNTADDLAAKMETVKQGLDNWPLVRVELISFIGGDVEEYGYVGTPLLNEVRRKYFQGDNSNVAIIDRFVKEFDEIGKNDDSNERNRRLEEFLKVVDEIHNELSKMRLDEPSGGFNKYFEKLCK